MTDMNQPEAPFYTRITAVGGSFRVGFYEGVDRADIIDAEGWVADELRVAEGTCEEIRAEAHRIIDRVVETGRYPGYSPKAGAAEWKRSLTRWCKSAQNTHHPGWKSGRHSSRWGGDPRR